jgi:hypothetical protein
MRALAAWVKMASSAREWANWMTCQAGRRDGVRTAIREGFAVVVPAGTNHNIINTGTVPLKLYTLYSPPNHRDGVVHHTRADAEADNEHFDGKTTE